MRVVIVGGGYAGISAALELANKSQVQVRLITRKKEFVPYVEIAKYLVKNKRSGPPILVKKLFKRNRNIQAVFDAVTELQPSNKIIIGASGAHYAYDKLLLSTGSRQLVAVPGLSAKTKHPYTYEGMEAVYAALTKLVTQRAPLLPHIVIVGAGAAGIELAGCLQQASRTIASVHSLPYKKIDVTLFEKGGRLLPHLNERAGVLAVKRLARVGVSVFTNTLVQRLLPEGVTVQGKFVGADLVVWAGGTTTDPLYRKHPQLFARDTHGKIETDEFLRSNDRNIFIAGDAGSTPFSGRAATAVREGRLAGRNILRDYQSLELEPYQPVPPRYFIPIGGRWMLYQHETFAMGGIIPWLLHFAVRRPARKF